MGNSFTYYNDLPSVVGAFAAMSGLTVEARGHTMPNAVLSTLFGMRQTTYMLKDEKWDFVVLQEGSMLPLTSPTRMAATIREFDASIRQAGAKTVLFMTWARENQPDTQAAISDAYVSVGREIGGLVAPVGLAWQVARQTDPKVPLYDADRWHPSPTGTYLSACTIFLTIFRTMAECPALELAGVGKADAAAAREAAKKSVLR